MAWSFRFSLRNLLMTTFWFSIFGGVVCFAKLLDRYTSDCSETTRTIVFVPLFVVYYAPLCAAIGALFGRTKAGLLCGLAIGALGALMLSMIGLDSMKG